MYTAVSLFPLSFWDVNILISRCLPSLSNIFYCTLSFSLLILYTHSQTQTSIKPVHCKSVLHSSSPAFTENPRDKAVIPATPANKGSSHQVSSGHPASKAGEMLVKKEQNLAGTPERVITSRTESDSTFSSDDASDDCCSSSPTTSSSLPSPEIFRKENYGVCVCVYSCKSTVKLQSYSIIFI